MMLPPTYRDLWKGPFQDIKSEDLQAGKDGLYASDPFQALKEHEDNMTQRAKKSEQREKERHEREEQRQSGAILSDSRDLLKGWKTAPKVEMGKRTRREVEALIKDQAVWNLHEMNISTQSGLAIISEIAQLGFREIHIQEAIQICKDREEILEWLLIHVPEDDLPKWSLPEGYSAGVSMASGNLKREGAIKRLAAGGYSTELCQETLDGVKGDEREAAEILQNMLLRGGLDDALTAKLAQASLAKTDDMGNDVWSDEQAVLESIYENRYWRKSETACEIAVENGQNKTLTLLISRPVQDSYPAVLPIVLVTGPIPAYIRLSITRQMLAHAASTLLGEQMIFNIVDWLEQETARITKDPGRLSDISAVSSAGASTLVLRQRRPQHRPKRSAKPISLVPGSLVSKRMHAEWEKRQQTPSQQKMLTARRTLPAWNQQEAIVSAVSRYQVVIISGETGSGKSTQAVQFILDDMIRSHIGEAAHFICTQPRRISALGLADRVADERCVTVGSEVGYAIRGESKQGPHTKISFCTTGVLLRRLQTSGGSAEDVVASLADVSHVFVDEVHERSLDTDFLLTLLRDILKKRKDLKVILMSATLDAKTFEDYFGGPRHVGKVEIEGRTYPVEDLYLDDALRMTGFNANMIDDDDENSANGVPQSISKGIQGLGMDINYDFITSIVRQIDRDLGAAKGAILIFLPGTLEINRTLDALRSIPSLHALPLHASLLPEEQRRVFPPPPSGKRKVIASTNVAETSITISDIVAVIDSGRVKETRYDPVSSTVKLTEVWASRAACKQRRGRAGRVQAGKCYKLFTRAAESKMAERSEPEIRRVPLEQLALSVKAMGVDDVPAFLAGTLTPPENVTVEGALTLLRRMGVLDGDSLTALGQHLAMVPADLRCAKLMVYGALFGCLEASVTIASILTVKSPFVSPQGKRQEADAARLAFGQNVGDPIVNLRAYDAWAEIRAQRPFREVRTWCEQNFLSWHTLNDIASTRSQYLSSLKEIGFLPLSYRSGGGSGDRMNRNSTSLPLLHALLLSALHPNTLRILYPPQKYTATSTGTLAVDPEARSIKFFSEQNSRAFIHPSSTLFSAQSFPSSLGGGGAAGFLSYWNKMETSKVMIREVSPASTFGLLLFAGQGVEVDKLGRGLVVDGWIRVRGWARIGALVGRLRGVLDATLRVWVENPGASTSGDGVVELVRKLVELDGLDA